MQINPAGSQRQEQQSSAENFAALSKKVLGYSFCLAIKFCYGFLFGTFIWVVIVEPYKRYVDLDGGSYLPEYIFSLSVAALFMLFLWLRAVMVLFLPSLVANASQNYIIVMLFILIFSNPVANIGLNAVESVRVIGCSLTMTFEQLKEKTKLILSPILEIMKDANETDLGSIRHDLLEIQKIVVNIKQEAEFSRNQSSEANIINRIKERQDITAPLPDKQVALKEISNRLNGRFDFEMAEKVVDKTRDVIEKSRLEFDRENFGIKMSFDARSLRKQLAESRKLLATGDGSVDQFNLTGILYENCLGIFRQAKPRCEEVVEDMRRSCTDVIGTFLGTLWCSPITLGLGSTCPWLMDQLIDEKGLCGQMLSSISNLKVDPFGVTGSKSVDEVYKDLTKQLISLDDGGLVDGDQEIDGYEMPQRLEFSVAFNKQTRDIFIATEGLLNFIQDKYKMRKLFLTFLWLIYDIYTTITFFKIIYQANEYRKNYLTKIRYDNHYITGLFVSMDKRRRVLGKESLLPLTKDEQAKYITTFTCKRRTSEEKETQTASCFMIILFLAFILALLYFDDIFHSLLSSIHDHALVYYKEIGHHELEVNVKGEGAIAKLVRRLTSRLSSVYDLKRITNTEKCLPIARKTTAAFYLQFTYLVIIYLAIDQLSIYAMRLRRLSAAFFYPSEEAQRIAYLYSLMLIDRRSRRKIGWDRELDNRTNDAADDEEENERAEGEDANYTIKDAFSYIGNCISESLACRCCDKRKSGSPIRPTPEASPANQPEADEISGAAYTVATHSVRITKHGYATDPVELRYPEIINNISTDLRRSSQTSFDGSLVGYQILGLIRGFWSQAAFPRGQEVRATSSTSIESIFTLFKMFPTYPHRETRTRMFVRRYTPHVSPKAKQTGSKSAKRSAFKKALSIITGRSSSSSETNDVSDKDDRNNKFLSLSPPTKSPFFGSTSPPEPEINPQTSKPSNNSKKKPNASSPNAKQKNSKASNQLNQTESPPQGTFHTWIPRDRGELGELISNLCRRMESVFSKEARIVSISSPCHVLGDIHGNLHDLRTYERSLWPKAPCCLSSNYLFLGDYVDRGDYSVECVLYLFSMKLIAPQRFFLLRGNHEVAAIQRQYTFAAECETKFGPMGRTLWRSFNRVFDLMPLAAIIDNKIFCAHGGIPRSVTDIKILARTIPSPLDNPEIQSPAAWEMLWNDPITDGELIGMIEMDNAVVTQTQVTQVQPTPDGNELVTTTTNSMTIATTAPDNNASTGEPNGRAVVAKEGQAAKQTASVATKITNDAGLSEADAILTREPSEALSFYIRPDNQPESSYPVPIGTTIKEGNAPIEEVNEAQQITDDEGTLRTVPSDTSSVASTSPQQILNDGFIANIKRGTAYLFSDQAINHFLKANKLSHVIRAHEVIPTGFAFHGDGRVITIFSSSKYCGLNNQAACAFVDRQRIRILRLDTGDAGE